MSHRENKSVFHSSKILIKLKKNRNINQEKGKNMHYPKKTSKEA